MDRAVPIWKQSVGNIPPNWSLSMSTFIYQLSLTLKERCAVKHINIEKATPK